MTPESLLPANEPDRLLVLHQHEAVALLHEPIFDEFVRLTARIFNLPISLISLIDANEAIYIANRGVPNLVSQPRVEAICALAVRDNKAVVFADLTSAEQQRLTDEALRAAEAKNFQFYAGAPLRMLGQLDIGALCVLDHQPRSFSAAEQSVLEKVSEIVAKTLAVRHYCLTQGIGEDHWQVLQAHLVEQVGAIEALVRYLIKRIGVHIPVAPTILQQVLSRLTDLHFLLDDYYQSKQ